MTSPVVATSSPEVSGICLALLFEIGVEELLVVAAGDEADLLRVGLFGERQAELGAPSRGRAGLVQLAEREEGAGELLLGEAEEEISLVLGGSAGRLRIQRRARGRTR